MPPYFAHLISITNLTAKTALRKQHHHFGKFQFNQKFLKGGSTTTFGAIFAIRGQ